MMAPDTGAETANPRTSPDDIRFALRSRNPASHKGDNGKVLVLGGSQLYTGAPMFSALAALRSGVDLAYIAAPHRVADVAARDPNLIALPLEGDFFMPDHISQIPHLIDKADVIVLGPGIGREPETKDFCDALCRSANKLAKKMVIDADALKLLDKKNVPPNSVLTPHAGEFEALTGQKVPGDLEKKKSLVRKYAKKLNCVILLKGQTDIISDGASVKTNDTGNAGMTHGGTGDVLTGIVAGLIAQGASPFEAACAAAYVNGRAGDECFSEKKYYFLASDMLEKIPKILKEF